MDVLNDLKAINADCDNSAFLRSHELRQPLQDAIAEIERLHEALRPFALFANAAEAIVGDTDRYTTPIAQHKHQAIILGAFQNAHSILFPKIND